MAGARLNEVLPQNQAIQTTIIEPPDRDCISLDSVICLCRDDLDAKTWSPMMKEHSGPIIKLPISELLRYALIQSDNNASNIMFEKLAGVRETDGFIATLIPRSSFKISFTESEMAEDHDKAYSNYTSPLGAAVLINRLYNDSLVSYEKQEFVRCALRQCITGKDRIAAPLEGIRGVEIAHKTGSGYTNENGQLSAHNDVGFITLPGGHSYSLAVFVKDFNGTTTQASRYIAHVSAAVYSLLSETENAPGI